MQRFVLALAVSALVAAGAHAEIFKCIGPNGDVRFTSNAAQCPNAAPHAPKEAAMQRAEKPQPLATARPGAMTGKRRAPAAAMDESAGAEGVWRNKKLDAERQLREVEAQLEGIKQAVHWCNDGNLLWTEDDRTGIRQDVPCSQVDFMKAELAKKKTSAELYLAEGLEEDCRRAGCLPGWLR